MSSPEPITDQDHASDMWSLVHAERAALAADLADLTDQQWVTRSLCTGFTVRQVLAHLTAGASLNQVRFRRDDCKPAMAPSPRAPDRW
jgi:uncharacterized protein (TIGR03083 family)